MEGRREDKPQSRVSNSNSKGKKKQVNANKG
jgi:hypothetical protein